jgi:hypothetical protein
VPAETLIVSPSWAASSAAWIVLWQPLPPTHCVAATAGVAPATVAAAASTVMSADRFMRRSSVGPPDCA